MIWENNSFLFSHTTFASMENKEEFFMSELSELDVQNLRHLIGGSETCQAKFSAYAEQSTDQQVKQYFQQAAQSAKENKQQLMGFLK